MENEKNAKQFVITVDGSEDADNRDGRACSGYVLIAFDNISNIAISRRSLSR